MTRNLNNVPFYLHTTENLKAKHLFCVASALSVCALCAYLPGIHTFFFYSDFLWVNRMIEIVASGFDWLFVLWRVPSQLLFYADYHFFHNAPEFLNATGMLLHILCSFLVFILAYRFSGRISVAALSAVIFCLHPTSVESLFWKTQIQTLAGTFFLLMAFNQYLIYSKSSTRRDYYITVAWFFLCMLTYEAFASFAFLIFAYDYFRGDLKMSSKEIKKWARRQAPIVLITAATFIIRGLLFEERKLYFSPRILENIIELILKLVWSLQVLIFPFDRFICNLNPVSIVFSIVAVAIFLLIFIKGGAGGRFAVMWILITVAPLIATPDIGREAIHITTYSYVPKVAFSYIASFFLFKYVFDRIRNTPRFLPIVAVCLLMTAALFAYCRQRSVQFAEYVAPMQNFQSDLKMLPGMRNVSNGEHLVFINLPKRRFFSGEGVFWVEPFVIKMFYTRAGLHSDTIRLHYFWGYEQGFLKRIDGIYFGYSKESGKITQFKDAKQAETFAMEHPINEGFCKYVCTIGDLGKNHMSYAFQPWNYKKFQILLDSLPMYYKDVCFGADGRRKEIKYDENGEGR